MEAGVKRQCLFCYAKLCRRKRRKGKGNNGSCIFSTFPWLKAHGVSSICTLCRAEHNGPSNKTTHLSSNCQPLPPFLYLLFIIFPIFLVLPFYIPYKHPLLYTLGSSARIFSLWHSYTLLFPSFLNFRSLIQEVWGLNVQVGLVQIIFLLNELDVLWL